MKGFLEYIPGDSILHRLDPRTKLLMPLILCLACFAADSILLLFVILLFDVALGYLGGIGKQTLRTLSKLARIMLFLFVLQILFIQRGETLIPLIAGLRITDEGLRTAALVALRLIAATMPLATLLSLTKLDELADSLVVRCHVPYKYAYGVTAAIRFIPEFSRQMSEIIEAQTARGVEFDTKNPFRRIAMVIPLCVPLLISSVRKIDGTAMAAELRGFNLRGRHNIRCTSRFGLSDGVGILVCLALAVAGVLL
ncbi:MAG: energy-coupling factor transporter transmembrane protein EcfT [Clostridia bacterium]|nr:energy-coupling factor transporter transmembrane protein EcfT [Clostridia bacterium]